MCAALPLESESPRPTHIGRATGSVRVSRDAGDLQPMRTHALQRSAVQRRLRRGDARRDWALAIHRASREHAEMLRAQGFELTHEAVRDVGVPVRIVGSPMLRATDAARWRLLVPRRAVRWSRWRLVLSAVAADHRGAPHRLDAQRTPRTSILTRFGPSRLREVAESRPRRITTDRAPRPTATRCWSHLRDAQARASHDAVPGRTPRRATGREAALLPDARFEEIRISRTPVRADELRQSRSTSSASRLDYEQRRLFTVTDAG